MPENDYSRADITVLTTDDAVRQRPAMYFGVAQGDPGLATAVFCAVVRHAVHPAARVAPSHTPHVVAEIAGDLTFTVTDDQAPASTGADPPELGYHGSLLTPDRWASAAAASVSTRTTVEVWRDGRGFRQDLTGLRPVGPPAAFPAPPGAGTRVTCALDPAYVGRAVITTDPAGLDVHGPYCTDPAGPGTVVIRDLRGLAH